LCDGNAAALYWYGQRRESMNPASLSSLRRSQMPSVKKRSRQRMTAVFQGGWNFVADEIKASGVAQLW